MVDFDKFKSVEFILFISGTLFGFITVSTINSYFYNEANTCKVIGNTIPKSDDVNVRQHLLIANQSFVLPITTLKSIPIYYCESIVDEEFFKTEPLMRVNL